MEETMRKALLSTILLLLSAIAFTYCPVPVTLTNEAIPCASGLSTDPSRVHACLWIQGMANWTTNSTSTNPDSPGNCNGGCDSDGTDSVDEICMLEGTGSIIVPWATCAGGNGGEYGLFTDWSTLPYDGCPSTDSSARAILLVYDDDGKYVLQSRSQGKDWDNWDEIGTTGAAPLLAPSVDYGQIFGNLFLPAVSGNIYGSYSTGDAPSAPLITGRRIYYYFGCTPPSNATSAWTAGDTYPLDAWYIESFDFPAAPEGLWIAYALVIDGHDAPFVSNYVSVPWDVGGTVVDEDPCSCTGLSIYPDHGCWDCIPFVDALIDGTELLQGISIGPMGGGWLYHGTCNVQHSIQFRGNYNFETYSCWSEPIYATDVSVANPPLITSVIDEDPWSTKGLTIYYTPGTPAIRHDLYLEVTCGDPLLKADFKSGETVGGFSCNSNPGFYLAAVNDTGECQTVYSGTVYGHEDCNKPPEIAAGLSEGDALLWSFDMSALTWPVFSDATGYRLYRGSQADLQNLPGGAVDNCCTRYNGTSASIDLSVDSPAPENFFWYLVTAYASGGEGSAGTGRIINSSGACP